MANGGGRLMELWAYPIIYGDHPCVWALFQVEHDERVGRIAKGWSNDQLSWFMPTTWEPSAWRETPA